jgi:archaellum component FlaC
MAPKIDLKEMYFTNKNKAIQKIMASIEQLEKQKQDLITSYTQILKDTSIPSSDKVQIIKGLSRAIANITDQINRMLPVQSTS